MSESIQTSKRQPEKGRILWRLIRIKWFFSRFRLPRMNVDTIQTSVNRFRLSQRHMMIRFMHCWDET